MVLYWTHPTAPCNQPKSLCRYSNVSECSARAPRHACRDPSTRDRPQQGQGRSSTGSQQGLVVGSTVGRPPREEETGPPAARETGEVAVRGSVPVYGVETRIGYVREDGGQLNRGNGRFLGTRMETGTCAEKRILQFTTSPTCCCCCYTKHMYYRRRHRHRLG
jgi:hypothetical protein